MLSSIPWLAVSGMVTFVLAAVLARIAYLTGKGEWLREKRVRERSSAEMDADDLYASDTTYGRRGSAMLTTARLGKILAPACGVAMAFFVDGFFLGSKLPPSGNAMEHSLANLAALLAGIAILFAVWRMSSGLGRREVVGNRLLLAGALWLAATIVFAAVAFVLEQAAVGALHLPFIG